LCKVVNNYSMTVKCFVLNAISIDLTKPHVIASPERIKDFKSNVRFTHLGDQGSICTISHIDRSVLFWSVSDQRFGTLEGVNMVLKNCHYFVFVEVGNPMKQGIEITGRISIESLAH